jgi:hypothetical protein
MTSILANVAVPMFFPQPLLMLAALVPVILVESMSLRRPLAVGFREVCQANALSTLAGLPMACLGIVGFNVLLTGADGEWARMGLAWRIISDDLHNWWILPLAMTAIVLPCFVLSVVIEGRFLARNPAIKSRPGFWRAVVRAHVFSYLMLLALDCLWFTFKLSL